MENTYEVVISRTSFATRTVTVEAVSEQEAKDKAVSISRDVVWGSSDCYYEVEFCGLEMDGSRI